MQFQGYSFLLLFLLAGTCLGQASGDKCRVYVIDNLETDKGNMAYDENEEVLPKGVTVIGRFTTKVAEEEGTEQLIEFPKKNLSVLARVYYTDESLRTKWTWNSMTMSLFVAEKGKQVSAENSAHSVAEFPYIPNAKLRTIAILEMEDHRYSVTLECECLVGEASVNDLVKELCHPYASKVEKFFKPRRRKMNVGRWQRFIAVTNHR